MSILNNGGRGVGTVPSISTAAVFFADPGIKSHPFAQVDSSPHLFKHSANSGRRMRSRAKAIAEAKGRDIARD